jgi:hypothetical protein
MEPSLEQDTCPVCGVLVKKQNLSTHYEKVHPKRASSLSNDKRAPAGRAWERTRRRRRLVFYGLICTVLILSSIVVAEVISGNIVRFHNQSQLSILIEGVPSSIPSGVGINQSLWLDHSLDRYGVGGHSPLTTRDTSGTIHVDSNTVRNFTLEEFLRVWGETVDNYQVVGNQVPSGYSACIVVNGQTLPVTSDVILADNQKITAEIVPGNCSLLS